MSGVEVRRYLCFSLMSVMISFAQTSDLYRHVFMMDGHVHMINRQFYLGGDIGQRQQDGQVDLLRIRQAGLNAFFFSLFSSEEYYPRRFEVKHTLRLMDLALCQIKRNSGTIEVALRASDIERINKAGKIAAVLDLEGGFDLDGDLGVLRVLYRLGLRSAMLPAHNFANNFADTCAMPGKWHGLNERGRSVIHEMNRLGVVINVAHGSDETIRQAAKVSTDPIFYSHGGSRHFVDFPRNISDEAAKEVASKGGIIGLNFDSSFHSREYYYWRQKGLPFGDISGLLKRYGSIETIEALDREVVKKYPFEPPHVPEELRMSSDQFVAVIDYLVNLVGEDHVALGSDFDAGIVPPQGINDISDYPEIMRAMQHNGYSLQRIRKILGLNVLRLFRQVTEK